jgi:hypothetical protein
VLIFVPLLFAAMLMVDVPQWCLRQSQMGRDDDSVDMEEERNPRRLILSEGRISRSNQNSALNTALNTARGTGHGRAKELALLREGSLNRLLSQDNRVKYNAVRADSRTNLLGFDSMTRSVSDHNSRAEGLLPTAAESRPASNKVYCDDEDGSGSPTGAGGAGTPPDAIMLAMQLAMQREERAEREAAIALQQAHEEERAEQERLFVRSLVSATTLADAKAEAEAEARQEY